MCEEIFIDLDADSFLLEEYVSVTYDKKGSCIIVPQKAFDAGEFSDHDMEVMHAVVNKYGHLNSKELADITCAKGSLWGAMVRENGLSESFEKEERSTSGVALDLGRLVADDPFKAESTRTTSISSTRTRFCRVCEGSTRRLPLLGQGVQEIKGSRLA